jgi:hypothetical protein
MNIPMSNEEPVHSRMHIKEPVLKKEGIQQYINSYEALSKEIQQ